MDKNQWLYIVWVDGVANYYTTYAKAKEYYEKGEFSKGGIGAADIRKANRKKLMKRKTGGMVYRNYYSYEPRDI